MWHSIGFGLLLLLVILLPTLLSKKSENFRIHRGRRRWGRPMVFPGRVYPSFRYFPVPVQQLPPLVSTTPFVGKKCEMNGVEGICQDYTTTACPNGSYVKGKCAGPNSVQCCVPNLTKENYATGVGSSCSVNGIKGVCRDTYTTSCTGGKFVTGKCPGPKNVQCCAPTASEFAGTPCGT